MITVLPQFKEQFPEIYSEPLVKDKYGTYAVLYHFAENCAQHFEEEKAARIIDAINKVYQKKNLFTWNAIKIEFFSALAGKLGVNNLMKHLPRIPDNLWPVYLKVLIETQKTIIYDPIIHSRISHFWLLNLCISQTGKILKS